MIVVTVNKRMFKVISSFHTGLTSCKKLETYHASIPSKPYKKFNPADFKPFYSQNPKPSTLSNNFVSFCDK